MDIGSKILVQVYVTLL